MAQNNKNCMELPFNRNISYSQRMKTKEFWKFLENENKIFSKDDAIRVVPVPTKRIWYDQYKIFEEHGLDKAAFAAYPQCKTCSTKYNCGSSDSTCKDEQSYEELLQDMQTFDKKLQDKANSDTEIM
ncbi:uncharacterized protein LOC117602698 isoform X2 [Osmia lignaria lignaria]|uniref:uncharacterized protein LOC117602698 isoform X2 n=1 Tax=Osmia lignaria lignaria TaxID=1437193 RepID=UPI001478DB13|nr:uncharacterized protein LOC117602698 isoform X2 [Osmia lignaria]